MKGALTLPEALDKIASLKEERKKVRELVKALRAMVIAAHEAGGLFVHVELNDGGKLVLRAADKWLADTSHEESHE